MSSAAFRRVLRNAIANYFGTTMMAVVPLLTLPIYLDRLGDEQWGLIGFATTLQALLAIVDAGVSQVLVREFAVRFAREDGKAAGGALLKSCERVYARIALAVGITLVLLSWPIARFWLNVSPETFGLAQIAVIGAGALCALQLPGLLYRGVAVAAQDQARLNVILAFGSVVRFGGGVVAVGIYPSIVSYLLWHVISLGLEVFARRLLAWRAVGSRPVQRAESSRELRTVISAMGVWVAAAMVGAATVQLDKTLLAALRPIEELASYYVASQLAMGALQLFYPITTAMLPLLMRPYPSARDRLPVLVRLLGTLMLPLVLLGSVTASVGHAALTWAFDADRATQVLPLFVVLLVGIGCNALATVGYMNWLAENRYRRLMSANIAAFLVVLVFTPFLVSHVGVIGAAYAWAGGQAVVLLASLDWLRPVLGSPTSNVSSRRMP